jgi:hypothetical protein
MKKKIFLFVALFSMLSCVMAQEKWDLKKDENGIEVYTRKAAKGNIKELRVVCQLDATEAQLLSALENIGDYNSWVYSNKKSTILKTLNSGSIIYYTQSHLPWPIKDRDLVVQLSINPTTDVLNIEAKSLPDYIPGEKDFIRVPYSLALWKVTQAPNNKIDVDYTFSVDPGGSIPSWIVNATLTIGPYNSFVKLREVLKAHKNLVYRPVTKVIN